MWKDLKCDKCKKPISLNLGYHSDENWKYCSNCWYEITSNPDNFTRWVCVYIDKTDENWEIEKIDKVKKQCLVNWKWYAFSRLELV